MDVAVEGLEKVRLFKQIQKKGLDRVGFDGTEDGEM